jgi:regulator of sigma E protease
MVPLLFMIGVPFEAPIAGSVSPGGAAWEAGVRQGDRILEVGGERIHGFRNIATAVALAPKEAPIPLLLADAEGHQRTVEMTPAYDVARGFQEMGIGPLLQFVALPDSPAAQVLGPDAVVQTINGYPVDDPLLVALLLDEARIQGSSLQVGYVQPDGTKATAALTSEPVAREDLPSQLGISLLLDEVQAVGGVLASTLQVHDRLLRLDGKPVRNLATLSRALYDGNDLHGLEIERDGVRFTAQDFPPLTPADLSATLKLGPPTSVRYAVDPQGAAYAAGLRSGDSILRLGDVPTPGFAELRDAVNAHAERNQLNGTNEPLSVTFLPAGATTPQTVAVTLAPVPVVDFHLAMEVVFETVQSPSPIEAFRMGTIEARRMVTEVLTTVQRMATGEIDSKNLGGIITIGTVTHSFAGMGLIPLLFFLCLISINLGVLNLLPIPALDGGHILFALFEIVARRPVSMVVQNVFNVVGVFLVLGMLIFVTMMDINRLLQ